MHTASLLVSDEDQNEKPATEQFEDEPDPEHDEVASSEHDESSSEDEESSGGDDEPATAKFDETPDEQPGASDTDTGSGTSDESGRKQAVTGGEFERELDLDRETTADFLEDLADQLRAGNSLTVSGDDWEIPFEYAEPIEVEIEPEGDEEDRELEIEIEFEWGGDGDSLEVR